MNVPTGTCRRNEVPSWLPESARHSAASDSVGFERTGRRGFRASLLDRYEVALDESDRGLVLDPPAPGAHPDQPADSPGLTL
jgi:hypothetical protein